MEATFPKAPSAADHTLICRGAINLIYKYIVIYLHDGFKCVFPPSEPVRDSRTKGLPAPGKPCNPYFHQPNIS